MHAIDRRAVAQALAPMGGDLHCLQPASFPGGFTAEQLPPELRYPSPRWRPSSAQRSA